MIASVLHRAAGLTFSADRPLPGFVPETAAAEPADVSIHLQSRPDWHKATAVLLHTSDAANDDGVPIAAVSRSARGFHFVYADGTHAWIDTAGANVWSTWPSSATLEDTCTYLYGPILGLVLRLRGALALHASAVDAGRGAIGFVGPHGAGKSTLAAALRGAGARVLTDDVLHVKRDRGRWIVEPFASMLKLWPEGARLALGASADLPHIAVGWNKRALALGGAIPADTRPVPLAALACLADPAATSSIAPLPAAAAMLRLAANSSSTHLLDREQRAAEFAILSPLVRDVPCVTVVPPLNLEDYPAFVQQVLAWSR